MRRLEGRSRRPPGAGVARAAPAAARARSRAVVIGGGLGGMASALRLRAAGHEVTLVEQCDQIGGRAQTIERGGFRFDAGPTVLGAPWLVDELFALFGRRLADDLRLVEPVPGFRYLFPDGSRFDCGPGRARTEAEVARLSPRDVAGFRAFSAHAAAMYEVAFEQLAGRPHHDLRLVARCGVEALRLRAWESVWQVVRRHFHDDRLRWAFSMPPLLIGGHPARTTSLYTLIAHLTQEHGVWFPEGGMGALVAALGRLMADVGIETRLSTPVREIIVENGAATGVRLDDGRTLPAALVVSNCDPLHLYGRMLPDASVPLLPRLRLKAPRLSMGVFVLHLGTRRRWPEVAHHTVLFDARHRQQIDAAFSGGPPDPDSTLYVARPTATDPGLAPPGGDSLYVLCPVPNLGTRSVDWAAEGPRLRDSIVRRLDRSLLPGLARSIVEEVRSTPQDFRDRLSSVHGAAFSLAPHLLQTAFFRFHNRGEGIRNLYLVGAGTHPGAGIPGVLQSAKAVSHLVAPAEQVT